MSTKSDVVKKKTSTPLTLREIAVFGMLGTLMFCSKVIMAALPNIHLLGMFIMTFTILFRTKALLPIYVYVVLEGLFFGFTVFWIPYLYIWTILWGVTMLLPQRMPKKLKCILYPSVCCLHGLLFGTLFAPVQAVAFGFDFEKTLAWIIAGIPFDITHGIGNLFTGMLVLPLTDVISRFMKRTK